MKALVARVWGINLALPYTLFLEARSQNGGQEQADIQNYIELAKKSGVLTGQRFTAFVGV